MSKAGPGLYALYHENPPHEALMGDTFPVLCHFWRIVHGSRWIYYPDEGSPPENFALTLVEHKFRELIAWVEALPRSLVRTKDSPHHVVVFQ